MLKNRLMAPEGEVSGGGSSTASTSPAPASSPSPSTAAPSAAPAASVSSAPSQESSSAPADAFDFGSLAEHHSNPDGNVAPAATPAVPTQAAPAQPAVPAAPVVAASAPTPPAEPPVAQPATAATVQTPASQEATPPQQVDWQKHRETFLPKLQEMYKLSEEEVQEFQTNPGVALPKLAAELHYKVMMALHSSMLELMPHVAQSTIQHGETSRKYENQFYDRWPKLKDAVSKDPKVEAAINEGIKAYRTVNPKASVDDIINKVGLLTMISMGINPQEVASQPTAPVAQIPAGMIPGRPAGVAAQAHVPMQQHGQAPGSVPDADFFGELANFHLSGG